MLGLKAPDGLFGVAPKANPLLPPVGFVLLVGVAALKLNPVNALGAFCSVFAPKANEGFGRPAFVLLLFGVPNIGPDVEEGPNGVGVSDVGLLLPNWVELGLDVPKID